MKNKILTTLFLTMAALTPALAANFQVTSSGDADTCDLNSCTLRGAISQAALTPEADTLTFQIPADGILENYLSGGSGDAAYFYWLIQPLSELPTINNITIDGASAGNSPAGNPTIVIDGSLAGIGTNLDPLDGLTLQGDALVNNLALINWDHSGLRMASGSNNSATASWFGLNLPYGLAGAPNYVGISYDSEGNNNRISGVLGSTGNVISGNSFVGVETFFESANVLIAGNLIGTDPSGEIAVPNDEIGVFLKGNNHRLGASTLPLQNNLISGNLIGIQTSAYPYDEIRGHEINNNIIGLNLSTTGEIPNRDGLYIQDGRGFQIINNLIAGNDSFGISIAGQAQDVVVAGNRIGETITGDAFSNGTAIWSSGGAERVVIGPDNHISNNRYGIRITGFSSGQTQVKQNKIFDNDFLGIDLGTLGATPNDADDLDAGPNRYQNHPEILNAQHDPNGNRINLSYRVDSQIGASDYPITVGVYAADGVGEEGETWLGSTTFSEAQRLSGNHVSRTWVSAAPVNQGDQIVVTATDAAGRTSEFSPASVLTGLADFSLSCVTSKITLSPALSCSINCQAEAVNGWGDEVSLGCENPDSNCTFLPADEISFNEPVEPFIVQLSHNAASPGIYINPVVGSSDLQAGVVERQNLIVVKQLANSDYVFNDGFDGVICQ